MLVSSHILPEIEQTCDRVIIIARGRVRADGALECAWCDRCSRPFHTRWRSALRRAGGSRCIVRLRDDRGRGERAASSEGTEENWARFIVTPKGGQGDLREPIARAIGVLGVVCRELRRAQPTLEQVFMRVIESDDRTTLKEQKAEETA